MIITPSNNPSNPKLLDEIEIEYPTLKDGKTLVDSLGITFEDFPATIVEISDSSPLLSSGIYVGMKVDTIRIGKKILYHEMSPEQLSNNLKSYRKKYNNLYKHRKTVKDNACYIRFVAPHYICTPPPIPKFVVRMKQQGEKTRHEESKDGDKFTPTTIFDHDSVSVISFSDDELIVVDENDENYENIDEGIILKHKDGDEYDDDSLKSIGKVVRNSNKRRDANIVQILNPYNNNNKDRRESVNTAMAIVGPRQVSFEDSDLQNSDSSSSDSDGIHVSEDSDEEDDSKKESRQSKNEIRRSILLRRQKSVPTNISIPFTLQRQKSVPTNLYQNNIAASPRITITKKPINDTSRRLRDKFSHKQVGATITRRKQEAVSKTNTNATNNNETVSKSKATAKVISKSITTATTTNKVVLKNNNTIKAVSIMKTTVKPVSKNTTNEVVPLRKRTKTETSETGSGEWV